ncbi:MAG TPA: FeoB small GTPase domain-containing protein, partial [Desulfosarcina sp.]|nr:FeoB small GTPase domain-containing protein [Desulfosarcina sp.]
MTEAIFALAGNPNSGKTTLFNALTGARQHVGNYPGVTVEKKEGIYVHEGRRLKIVDLPGTYSLTAYSLEEVVARDFLVNEKPAAVIDIVDASNLERHLYLTLQFMEMGVPVIVALNMIDVAAQRGMTIDTEKLAKLLGVPVVATIARRGEGKAE